MKDTIGVSIIKDIGWTLTRRDCRFRLIEGTAHVIRAIAPMVDKSDYARIDPNSKIALTKYKKDYWFHEQTLTRDESPFQP